MDINICVSVPENGVELLEILCKTAVTLSSGSHNLSLSFTYHNFKTKDLAQKVVSTMLPSTGYFVKKEESKYFHVNSVTHSLCIQKLYDNSKSDVTVICDNDVALIARNWDEKLVNYLSSGGMDLVGVPYSDEPGTVINIGQEKLQSFKYQGIPNCIFIAFKTDKIKNIAKNICTFAQDFNTAKTLPFQLVPNKERESLLNIPVGRLQHIDSGNLIPEIVFKNDLTVKCFRRCTNNYQVLKSVPKHNAISLNSKPEEYFEAENPFLVHFKKGTRKAGSPKTSDPKDYAMAQYRHDVLSWLSSHNT